MDINASAPVARYTAATARSVVANLPRMNEAELREALDFAKAAVKAQMDQGGAALVRATRVRESVRYALDVLTANACEWCAGTREDHQAPGNRCTTPQFGTPAE